MLERAAKTVGRSRHGLTLRTPDVNDSPDKSEITNLNQKSKNIASLTNHKPTPVRFQ